MYQPKKLIGSLALWAQCFSLYTMVLASRYPDRTPDMLGCIWLMAKLSSKYKWPSWVSYDQSFRMEAVEKDITVWATLHLATFTECFTGTAISGQGWCTNCGTIDHATDRCPLTPLPEQLANRQTAQRKQGEVCKRYNRYDRDCCFGDRCRYQHCCEVCMGHHPKTRRKTETKKTKMGGTGPSGEHNKEDGEGS